MKPLVLGVLLAILSWVASAHEMRPSIASLSIDSQGVLQLELVTNMEAWLANVNPSLSDTNDSPNVAIYDRFRALDATELEVAIRDKGRDFSRVIEVFAGDLPITMTLTSLKVLPVDDDELPRDTQLNFVGGLPDGVESVRYRVNDTMPNTAVRLFLENAEPRVQFIKSGQESGELSLDRAVERSVSDLVVNYVELGFTHIIPRGLDHIIFILGLTLISKRLVDLVIQVTAFTVAHSVTLALGLYGVLELPASIVEPLIAASIIYIAVENIWHHKVNRSRALVVFAFGLLHGLGFASVLTELGLPERDFIVGLLSFNVGVELGQLAIILGAYLSIGIWIVHYSWYRARFAIPMSILIGLVGCYWFVERVMS
ncbi:MAG: HupE/UreJ family protein [Pseudomonadota bacterium]|nr:HupE/UreJ family protein [Pseudomonadota bacterium]